jgi:hypothetical protein
MAADANLAGVDMPSRPPAAGTTSADGSVAAEQTDSLQDAADVWIAGNAAQKQIELTLKTERLPPPKAANYAKQRLQQVSDLSRRIDAEYYKLYLQVGSSMHACARSVARSLHACKRLRLRGQSFISHGRCLCEQQLHD